MEMQKKQPKKTTAYLLYGEVLKMRNGLPQQYFQSRRRCQTRLLNLISYCLLSLFVSFCTDAKQNQTDAQDLSDQDPVELTAEVDRAEATIIDPFYFRITLEADPEISVSLPEIGPQIKGLRIVDMGSEGPKSREGKIWSQRWYQLQADITGSYLLPTVKISYIGPEGKEHFTETAQIFVEIKSVLDQETEGQDIRDIKSLQEINRELPLLWVLIGLGTLLILGIVIGVLIYRRKRKQDLEQYLLPEEQAQKELNHLEITGLLEEERYREYVFGLSLIFRRYLERKFQMPAAEQTTEEILVSLRTTQILTQTLKEMARTFLEETDPIKYTGLAPQIEETGAWRARLLSFLEQAAATSPEPEILKEAH